MKKVLFCLVFSISTIAFAQIETVAPGDVIQAQKINDLVTNVNSLNLQSPPVGTIIEVAGSCPAGYLSTAGQAVSRSTYSNLFNQIGIQYGNGDSTTTFNLPKTTKHHLGSISMVGCGMTVHSNAFNNFLPTPCTYAVTGDALIPETNIPGIRFASLPAGKIVVKYSGALTNNRLGGAGSSALFRLIDGSHVSRNIVAVGGATMGDNAVVSVPSAEWEIIRGSVGSNVTIQFQAKVTSTLSSSAVLNSAYVIGPVESILSVYHYPDKEIKGNCIKH